MNSEIKTGGPCRPTETTTPLHPFIAYIHMAHRTGRLEQHFRDENCAGGVALIVLAPRKQVGHHRTTVGRWQVGDTTCHLAGGDLGDRATKQPKYPLTDPVKSP